MNTIVFSSLLLLVVIAIAFIVPTIRPKISIHITWRRSFILAGLYLGVLIMLVPILYMLPDKGFIKLIDNNDQAITLSQNVISDLYNHLPPKGRLDKQQGIYKISSQTFKVDTDKLSLIINGPYTGNYHIFIERKEVDDGEIGVSIYVPTQSMGGIDFTKLISPPTISFQNSTLSFTASSHQRLDFRQFNPDVTVDQFKNRNLANLNRMSANFSGQVIYIRVPKNLEIDKGKYNDQIQMLSST